MTDTTASDRQDVADLVSRAEVGMLTSTTQGDVSPSDTENDSWTATAGRAHLVHDRQEAEQLYSSVVGAWSPDGLETPGLTLIEVQADTTEHRDGPTNTVAWAAGNLRAAVTGDPGNDPIRNETVEL